MILVNLKTTLSKDEYINTSELFKNDVENLKSVFAINCDE